MADEATPRGGAAPSTGPGRAVQVVFSAPEERVITDYAQAHGLTFEAAVQELFAAGLARRVRAHLGRRPSAAVRRFHRRDV